MKYKVGTRDSKLALTQTELVCESLIKSNPDLSYNQFEIVKIKTIGDKILNKSLSEIGGKNLFIKEIEEALLDNRIDFAVHSLKDMTANLHPKATIATCLKREDPRDAFISHNYKTLDELPKGSTVGTSSIRRASITLHYRPDLKIVPFRGNILTRIEKLKQNQVDATFLAMAGIRRLNIEESLYSPLQIKEFLPAISQGIIGVECRKNDKNIYKLLRSINHPETEICTTAERAFLECLEADCSVPIAAYATLKDDQISLDCLVINSKGKIFRDKARGSTKDAHKIGHEMGIKLKPFLIS
ncbi:MAG: hydroxymethylbilane synthase [Rickettsiales bacterium]|jgi:hydroxymethylbilane synthase|nr:hydroxymethylbilane synthase [Rickettsiales bacterium]